MDRATLPSRFRRGAAARGEGGRLDSPPVGPSSASLACLRACSFGGEVVIGADDTCAASMLTCCCNGHSCLHADMRVRRKDGAPLRWARSTLYD
jgi:hypothetical protein